MFSNNNPQKPKPNIEPLENGPLKVNDVIDFKDAEGNALETKSEMYLCRCGVSCHKPYCDGTHLKVGFESAKSKDRLPDRTDDYIGQEITVNDNRGICAHTGLCTANSPHVFNVGKDSCINPDADQIQQTTATIRLRPSGALSYTKNGILYKDLNRKPAIIASKNGPHYVMGFIKLKDDDNAPQSTEHYTLCRCGKSKNKPFCDGMHKDTGFKDNE